MKAQRHTGLPMRGVGIRIGAASDHGFDEPLGLLSDCHRRIEHFLHVLVEVNRQVPGGPLGDYRRALEGALKYFETAAPTHTADEEESLFPRLRASGDSAAQRALDLVERLERDHEAANDHHAAVNGLVRRWLDDDRLEPDDAAALGAHLSALRLLYQAHITAEDHDLFPAAARVLDRRALREMGREMAARRRVRWSDPGA